MRPLLVFGYRGTVLFAGSYSAVVEEDRRILATGKGMPYLTPIAEVSYDFAPVACPLPAAGDPGFAILKNWVQGPYRSVGRFGDFGDVLFVLEAGGEYILTGIGVKAFHKPGVATDLVPLVVNGSGQLFFVGVIRGRDPGKGLPATIGGFNGITGFHFDSAVETLFHEAREETGMRIELGSPPKAEDGPFPATAPVRVTLGGRRMDCTVHLAGIVTTSDEERNVTTGVKRVSFTAAYVLPIALDTTKDQLVQELLPQDLVEGNRVAVFQVGVDPIRFGIGHHERVFLAAVEKARSLAARP